MMMMISMMVRDHDDRRDCGAEERILIKQERALRTS